MPRPPLSIFRRPVLALGFAAIGIAALIWWGTRHLAATERDGSGDQGARSLADRAVALVTSQLREGTTQVDANGSALPWTSQPGALRTYNADGQLRSIIKLYSARTLAARSLTDLTAEDVVSHWNTQPDHWVDMNAPAGSRGPVVSGKREAPGLTFPIVDPRASRADPADSVEGFSYQDRGFGGVVMPGSGPPDSQRLPMPVRWIYALADGTLGTLDDAGTFEAQSGSAKPSKANPITGRLAFWTDDETCKLNLNTASEGVHWDSPRVATEEDRWLGASQPTNGEYQRYPGHPAMVCLSSVLFPHKRFRASFSHAPLPPKTGVPMQDMTEAEVQAIWRRAPFIFGEKENSPEISSSFGGRQRPAGLASPIDSPPSKLKTLNSAPSQRNLYASVDDYLITPPPPPGAAGTSDSAAVTPPADRFHQGRFFLTTHSAGSEITLRGTPKMALWPMAGGGFGGVDTELLSEKPRISATSCFSIHDVLVASSAHLRAGEQIRPYYFQRLDVLSPHNEFYNSSQGRNNVLWRSVTRQLVDPLPGFLAAADDRLGTFPSFGAKYGDGPFDDLSALTGLMLDRIRSENRTDGNLRASMRYTYPLNQGWGQVTPLCLCGGGQNHLDTWPRFDRPNPKGLGRFLTITEVALAIGLRNKVMAGADSIPPGTFYGDNQRAAESLGTTFNHYEIEVAVLLEGFMPAHGWRDYRPRASFALGGFDGPDKMSERRPDAHSAALTKDISIGDMAVSGKPLLFPEKEAARSTASVSKGDVPGTWVGWGSSLGCRFTTNLIAFKPLLWSMAPGEAAPAFRFSGTPNNPTQNHLRLIVADLDEIPDVTQGVDMGNSRQVIPLAFPAIDNASFRLPFDDPNPLPFTDPPATGGAAPPDETRISRARKATGGLYGDEGLIHPDHDIVQSLVPNHGDFRLLAAKRAVIQGREGTGAGESARTYPTFVAHPNYGKHRLAHALTEPHPALNASIRIQTPYTSDALVSRDSGYFEPPGSNDAQAQAMTFAPAYLPDFPIKPWAREDPVTLVHPLLPESLTRGAISGGRTTQLLMSRVFDTTRFDALPDGTFRRGPGRPDITGDFDNGLGPAPDGPYASPADEGDVVAADRKPDDPWPYFEWLNASDRGNEIPPVNTATFSPNRVIPSPGIFGSLPTGVQTNVPWQTLLLRPDLELIRTGDSIDPQRRHYGSRFPHDHLIMDLFWMPVVQPYPLSERMATKGKINMNYQILPFTHIKRATALHALLKPEKLLAIPDDHAHDYKRAEVEGGPNGLFPIADKEGAPARWRHFIDADQTLRQWEDRFSDIYPRGTPATWKPGAFISPSEICDQWLVPEGQALEDMHTFWTRHRLTGDNTKEQPYTNLYPRLTTRSNTFRLHVIAQSLRPNPQQDPARFNAAQGDQISAQYRTSFLLERTLDISNPDIPDYAQLLQDGPGAGFTPLDSFHSIRASPLRQ